MCVCVYIYIHMYILLCMGRRALSSSGSHDALSTSRQAASPMQRQTTAMSTGGGEDPFFSRMSRRLPFRKTGQTLPMQAEGFLRCNTKTCIIQLQSFKAMPVSTNDSLVFCR